jgi:hypothetical protein
MQAIALPFTAGLKWIEAGWRLFRLQPFTFLSWSMFLNLVLNAVLMTAMSVFPIAAILLPVFLPAIHLMTLTACKEVSAGHKMQLGMWLTPLRQSGVLKKMFTLGALYFATFLLTGLASQFAFMSEITSAIELVNETNNFAPLLSAMRGPLIIFACLQIPVVGLFWYAPALAGWHGISIVQSLFFSLVACWRNKLGLIVYALLWLGILLSINLITGLMLSLGLGETAVWAIQMPLNIIAVSVLYCSFYTNYVTVFNKAIS